MTTPTTHATNQQAKRKNGTQIIFKAHCGGVASGRGDSGDRGVARAVRMTFRSEAKQCE